MRELIMVSNYYFLQPVALSHYDVALSDGAVRIILAQPYPWP